MDPRLVLSFVFAVAALASAQHDHHNHAEHRVDVAVYYESLCPDSRKFFTQQLYPSLQTNLADFVNLTLVPYGKTKSTFDVNSYQFECHHGPAECKGNKIQACALKLVQDPNPGTGFNKVAVGFINCLMDKAERKGDNATFPTIECARINHVSNVNDIDNCADHTDASNYLADYGRQTDKIQSSLKSVPTIVFKNQYKEDDSKMAQTSFVKVLCSYIEHDKPQECLKNGASGSLYLAKLGNQTRNLQNPLGNMPSLVFSEEYKKEESDVAENDFIKALCTKIQGEKPAECHKNGGERLASNVAVWLLVTMFTCYVY